MEWTTVAVRGGRLEVADAGSGDPVVFIQTALTADELRPLATDPALAGHRRILHHRRGYAGSSPADGPGSIPRDVADCAALLAALGIERAHVVGLSYSGAIALQFAADHPGSTHSLILIEPPPVHTPSSEEFRAANAQLLDTRQQRGPAAALDEFLTAGLGPDWQEVVEDQLPGATRQMQQDARTFFDTDVPALLDWQFSAADAARIGCPVLHVGGGGSDSGDWFVQVREQVLTWLPQAEDVVVDGADHWSLPTAPELAVELAAFLRRHQMPERPPGRPRAG